MIQFTVYGRPQPQGSTRAFIPRNSKRIVVTSTNTKLKPWRQQISDTAISLGKGVFNSEIPLLISMDFYFHKPKSSKRVAPTVRPDLDKLVRGVFDSLTGILIHDDAQVVDHRARKHYGAPERVEIKIMEAM